MSLPSFLPQEIASSLDVTDLLQSWLQPLLKCIQELGPLQGSVGDDQAEALLKAAIDDLWQEQDCEGGIKSSGLLKNDRMAMIVGGNQLEMTTKKGSQEG